MKSTTKTNSRTDVEALLEQLGIQIAAVGREITCHCPFHADRHPSFSINAKTGLWICYQCSANGTLDKLLTLVGKESNPKQALREIKHARTRTPKRTEEEVVPANPFYLYARYGGFSFPPDWALEERMIDPEQADWYGLRWSKGWIIPIWAPRVRDLAQDFWGWQFKRLDVVSNYPKAIKKSQTLFGMSVTQARHVVLVESPLDVVRLASADVAAVASYGAFVSKYQLGLLEGRFDRVTLALDNDREGNAQTTKIYPWLARRVPTKIAHYPKGVKDPGDMTDEQVHRVFG